MSLDAALVFLSFTFFIDLLSFSIAQWNETASGTMHHQSSSTLPGPSTDITRHGIVNKGYIRQIIKNTVGSMCGNNGSKKFHLQQ